MVFGKYTYPAQLITVDCYPFCHLAWLINISDLPCLQALLMNISKVYPYPKKHNSFEMGKSFIYIYGQIILQHVCISIFTMHEVIW